MIDIHTHILPGVDDGAKDEKESLAMARIAVDDGITHLFATPHSYFNRKISRTEVADRVAKLQAALDADNIPLILIPGYEVRLDDDAMELWAADNAGPLGASRYVLAEPPFTRYDDAVQRMMFGFFDKGFVPIMAHPERIRPIQDNLQLLEAFVARGGLTQITAGSLTGEQGGRAQQTAESIVKAGMAHIIASDAHHSYRRKPTLMDGVRRAALFIGETQAQRMVTATPMMVVDDEPISAELLTTYI